MADLNGKVVIITGAARGIGAATAEACVGAGAQVIITDILDDGEQTAQSLGNGTLFVHHDATDEDAWHQVVSRVRTDFGRIDGLVNNAGVAWGSLISQTSFADFERVLKIDLSSVFLGIKIVADQMQAQGGGAIVNISSAAGLTGLPLTGPYGAAKWGVRGLTKIAAVEFATAGIRVNSVHPGMTVTPMTEESAGVRSGDAFPFAAAGRMGNPNEIAAVNAFLLSDAASYVTGAEVAVDGGWTAGEPMLMQMNQNG